MQLHGGNCAEIARKYDLDEQTIIDFSSNINPLGLPKGIGGLIEKDTALITRYPDIHSSALKEIIASRFEVDATNVIVGNGSTELIYLLPRVFNPGTALMLQPTFTEYQASLAFLGCRVRHLLLDERAGFRVPIDGMFPLLPEVDIIYVCNPNNPTGVLVKRDDLMPLINEAAQKEVLVVIDESFMDFAGDESLAGEAVKRTNLIVLKSMTKFFAIPGLRLGYLIANRKTVARISKHKEPWSVNVLAQKVGAFCLQDNRFYEKSRQFVSRERHYLRTQLNSIKELTAYDSSANFLLLKILAKGLSSTEIYRSLAREGLLIRDCRSFRGMGTKFIRIAVKKRKQNRLLVETLRKIVGMTDAP